MAAPDRLLPVRRLALEWKHQTTVVDPKETPKVAGSVRPNALSETYLFEKSRSEHLFFIVRTQA